MSEKSLAARLQIKPGCTLLLLNAPPTYQTLLAPLPAAVRVATTRDGDTLYDRVQVFVYHRADIETRTLPASAALKPGGVFWISYPKKTGSIKTDITRDVGWETLVDAGWGGVTQIAIDATWSALRFRPEVDVQRRGQIR